MNNYFMIKELTGGLHRIALSTLTVSALVTIMIGLIIPSIISICVGVLFLVCAMMSTVPDLRVIDSVMTSIVSLILFSIHLFMLVKGEYSTLFNVLLGLIGWGLVPLTAGVLLIISGFRSREGEHKM